MATTTNYGWATPDDTALVKDGASAIRTLGSSVDTTTKALNPSTTLGDIEYRSSTANTNTRLGIGSTGQILTVAGGVPSWATPTAGGMTLLASGSIGSSGVDLTSISSSYQELKFIVKDIDINANGNCYYRLNNDSGGNYYQRLMAASNGSAFNDAQSAATYQQLNYNAFGSSTNGATAIICLPNYKETTGYKITQSNVAYINDTGGNESLVTSGFWKNESAIDRITFGSTATFDAGATYELWGIR
jgi:hypothetical protein